MRNFLNLAEIYKRINASCVSRIYIQIRSVYEIDLSLMTTSYFKLAKKIFGVT